MMTDRYAVIGNPIKHSKSPEIHTHFAKQTQQNMEYTLLCCAENELVSTIDRFREDSGKGLNVTLPFKQQAFDYADELSGDAKAAGAVNTLWFREDGSCYGHNTDGIGLIRDLNAHGVALQNKKVLLLGAGGAARGALLPLLREQPAEIVVANRTAAKAEKLVEQLNIFLDSGSAPCSAKRYAALVRDNNNGGPNFDLIINATSASLQNVNLPISEKIISEDTICYDMAYQEDLTCFLQWAKDCGAKVLIDGKGMLLQQAAESFYLWRGVRPNINHY
jgi:shikimate dehydrogenase